MNRRALVYLGLASATLAGYNLYVHHLQEKAATLRQSADEPAAQALASLSIVDGSLTTGEYEATVKQGQRVQFLVHSNQTDSLIVEGLDARVPLPAGQTTLVNISASTAGRHDIQLDLAGTTIGSIEVLAH
ncbi:MAG TPA: hypothetical protein VFV28_05140 [Limnobacter sp.]|nr:hypothetical protein [Limnobacter sp.]